MVTNSNGFKSFAGLGAVDSLIQNADQVGIAKAIQHHIGNCRFITLDTVVDHFHRSQVALHILVEVAAAIRVIDIIFEL